jgi:hypothetical protein
MLFCLLLLACLIAIGIPARPSEQRLEQATEETKRLESLATRVLGLDFGKINQSGAERNIVGIRSDNLLFSQRRDSRTYFIQDQRFGADKGAGVFRGSDSDLLGLSREMLERLKIPLNEIDHPVVLHEKTQVGYVDPKSRKVITEEPGEGKSLAEFSRKVEGIPVFSSRALIGLTGDKKIGYMELHWPVIPDTVLREAHRLQELVKGGWRPPEQKGARPESIEPGIIHSPAIGFVMDIYPAIRVIYASDNETVGKKMTLYLDGNGREVPVPRQFEKLETPYKDPRQYKKS